MLAAIGQRVLGDSARLTTQDGFMGEMSLLPEIYEIGKDRIIISGGLRVA